MATIGSLVIGLSLGTAGLAMGLNNVEAQLKAFENRVNGQGAASVQAAAYQQVKLAQEQVVVSQQKLAVSQARLTELQSQGTVSASSLAAANLAVSQSAAALAAAEATAAGAQAAGAASVAAAKDKLYLANARLSISQLRVTELNGAETVSAASLASAQLAVTRNKMAVAAAANGVIAAQAAANAALTASQSAVTVAQERLNISTLRLNELQTQGGAAASTLAAARLAVTRNTQALAAAEAELVAVQTRAANPAPVSQMGGHFPFITAAVTIAGYALLQFSLNAVKAASAFEYEMTLIETQALATHAEVTQLSDAILGLAPSLQTAPLELSKSMFRFKSVGLDNANALEAMTQAAKGAKVGNASLDSVTTALIATMLSGVDGINSWTQAMGMLNAVVGVSNLRMEDLTNSLSSGILSTAKQFGLDFLDVGAALGVMSNQAVPAEEGATRLRISIALLAAPTAIAGRELAKIGLTQRALADEMRGEGGLVGALTLLKERMDAAGLDATEQSMLLKTAFGGSRSSAGILLLMNSLPALGQMYKDIEAKAGDFAKAWAAESNTAKANFDRFSATIDVLSVRIGNGLMPVMIGLAAVLGAVADKTIIVVPLFYLLITLISVALVRAVWNATAGLVKLMGQMALNVVAAVLMRTVFANLGAGIMVSTAEAAGGLGAFNTAMAAANLNAVGLTGVVGSALTPAIAGVGTAAGAATTPVLTLGGALGATSTGPLVAGLAGAAGAIEAVAATTGPLVVGLAGVDGAMAATAATGPIVAGLAGVGGAVEAVAASTGPLVAGLAGADGAIVATTATTSGLIVPLTAVGPAATTGAAGVGALGGASAAATGPVAALAAAINAAVAPAWAVILIIGALIAAIIYLLFNISRFLQGLRMVQFGLTAAKAAVLDFMSSIPVLGEAFKGAAQVAHQELEAIRSDIAKAEADISGSGGQFNPLGDISKLVQIQIDQAKAKAEESFSDLNATLIDLYGTGMAGVQTAAELAGTADMQAYARGIREAVDLPKSAFSDLVDALKTAMTPEQETARLIGELQSQELADGLASGSPAVVATAEALKKSIIDRLDEISSGAYTASKQTWEQWFAGWRDAQMAAGEGSSEITMSLRASGLDQLKTSFERLKSYWTDSLAPAPDAARAAMEQLRAEIDGGTASASDAAKAFVDRVGYSLAALKEIGATAGADLMTAIADEIESRQDAVMTSISKLHDVIVNGMSTAAQEAFLLAALAGEDIANGLASAEPDVHARAVAARDLIIQQLDFLSAGAYSKGLQAAQLWGTGYYNGMGQWVPPQVGGAPTSLGLTPEQLEQGKSDYQRYIESLQSSTSNFTSQYRSDMTSAFNEIKSRALEYFDAIHEQNLQAIRDAHDHRDALLDAKEALNQAPVTAAQKALDAQRKAIQEWRLRQAVATASTPEEYRDAVLALRDFLAQKHIDEMQAEVDSANDILDAKKKANDDQEQAQIDAENKRYEKQKKDFQRNLTALEAYLKNHPAAWRRTQNEIMSLLGEYGISYQSAGSALGADFAAGLMQQVAAAGAAGNALASAAGQGIARASAEAAAAVAAAVAAAAAIADLLSGASTSVGGGGGRSTARAAGGPVYKGQPTWVGESGREMFVPQTDGYVLNHADSLRAMSALEPAASPVSLDAIRRALERPEATTSVARVDSVASRASEGDYGGPRGSGNTIIFQVGDEKMGEITDYAMYRQTAAYGTRSTVRVGGARR